MEAYKKTLSEIFNRGKSCESCKSCLKTRMVFDDLVGRIQATHEALQQDALVVV